MLRNELSYPRAEARRLRMLISDISMLGERISTEITRNRDARGFIENRYAAKEGGEVAGSARKDAEKRIGRTIISGENFLIEPENKKKMIKER